MPGRTYRIYDQAALDYEYDNRRRSADAGVWLERYARESVRTREELPGRLDVAYGSHPGERLDVFPAPGAGPGPVHVFVHGGYWQRLDKADFSYVASAFRPQAAVVVVNYGLIPAVDMDELVRQCRAAIAWVYRNAASFGGDPARISVSGHSAGGHLVAMLLATDWSAFGVPGDVVRTAAAISGIYDLEPIRRSYLNQTLKLSEETVRQNSPIRLLPQSAESLLLAVGGLESAEYHRQLEMILEAWTGRGLAVEPLVLPALHHFSIMGELERPDTPLARAIRRRMEIPVS